MLQVEESLEHTKQRNTKLSTTTCFTRRTFRKYTTITITKLSYFFTKSKDFRINTTLIRFY